MTCMATAAKARSLELEGSKHIDKIFHHTQDPLYKPLAKSHSPKWNEGKFPKKILTDEY